jgi:hypothetical protein
VAGSGSGESGGDARKREALTGRFVGGWMDGMDGWMEPEKGIEPLTYALRVRCSAV